MDCRLCGMFCVSLNISSDFNALKLSWTNLADNLDPKVSWPRSSLSLDPQTLLLSSSVTSDNPPL
jgi:hypothetical protein